MSTDARDEQTAQVEWEPGRWWRAIAPDETVWAESSDEDEVRDLARPGDRIERLWITVVRQEWRQEASR